MDHPANIRNTGTPLTSEEELRHALWMIRVYARKNGHSLGRASDGMAECRNCGAVMVDSDALAYFKGAPESVLGSFVQKCPNDVT